ncbi:MAG TPA: serine--tRNA ligase [Solirubrobacteraceae bacterium]
MLDLRLIRRDPDAVRAALARRSPELAERVDELVELDASWREATAAAERLRAEQKTASEGIAAAKQAGEDAGDAIARMRDVSAQVKLLTERARDAEERLQSVLAGLPNLPDETAADEDEVVREVGEAGATGADHLQLAGERIDIERAARLSGSRFAYLRGDLVLLELALVRWALDKLMGHGFEPVIPPVLVREEALYGTGFLPDTEQQIYRLPDDDLYLVGTSEVALASLHAGEILEGLPLRYAGFSSCFRREAGAAGKDTRGIFRVHQFDKLEMFSFVEPDASRDEHERLLAIEEEILRELEIPYRVVNIGVGDLGASAAKKYDCEAWLPGQGRYREVTSTSNTTDFQARRLQIRYRGAEGARPEVLHTLNGTAVTWRHMIALLENGQRDDGSVALPAVLGPYGAPTVLPAPGASPSTAPR